MDLYNPGSGGRGGEENNWFTTNNIEFSLYLLCLNSGVLFFLWLSPLLSVLLCSSSSFCILFFFLSFSPSLSLSLSPSCFLSFFFFLFKKKFVHIHIAVISGGGGRGGGGWVLKYVCSTVCGGGGGRR